MKAADKIRNRTIEIIEKANERGIGQFHVFGDEPFYVAGEHVGKHRYIGTFNSLGVAQAIAGNQDNGKVYNASGQDVTTR